MRPLLTLLFTFLSLFGGKPKDALTPRQADSIGRMRIYEIYTAGDPEGSLDAIRDLIEYHREHDNDKYVYDAYATLFDRLHMWGRFDEALAVVEEMSSYAQEKNSALGKAVTSFCFGQFYLGNKQSKEAEVHYRRAFRELQALGENNRAIRAGFNLQAIAMNLGEPGRGLALNDSTALLIQAQEQKYGRPNLPNRFKQTRYRFVLLQRVGDLKAAAPLKDSLLHYAELINDPAQDEIAQTALIQYEQLIGDKQSAYARLDTLIARNLRLRNFQKATRYRLGLADYQRDNGDYALAVDNYRLYAAESDSAMVYSTNEQLNTLTKKYELNELRLKNKMARNRVIALTTIAALLLMGLFASLIYARKLLQKNRTLYHQALGVIRAEEKADLTLMGQRPENLRPEEKLYTDLLRLMNEKQFFKDPDFNRENLYGWLGTNRTYLADALKFCTGQTLNEFINHHRIRWAAEALVSDPELSVVAIGEDAGFNSRSTFNRLFREQYGLSPSDYRSTALRTA